MRVQVLTFSFKHVPVFIFHLSFKGCLLDSSSKIHQEGYTTHMELPTVSVDLLKVSLLDHLEYILLSNYFCIFPLI